MVFGSEVTKKAKYRLLPQVRIGIGVLENGNYGFLGFRDPTVGIEGREQRAFSRSG